MGKTRKRRVPRKRKTRKGAGTTCTKLLGKPELILYDSVVKGLPSAITNIKNANDVDVNMVDIKGNTLLHHAISKGYAGIAKALIDKGVDIEKTNANPESLNASRTPLMLTTMYTNEGDTGRDRIAKALIEKGADIRSRDEGGSSVLTSAIFFGKIHIVEALIASLPDSSTYLDEGEFDKTPLMLAVTFEQRDNNPLFNKNRGIIIERLIDGGADVNIRDESMMSPLDYAILKEQVDTIKSILYPDVKPKDEKAPVRDRTRPPPTPSKAKPKIRINPKLALNNEIIYTILYDAIVTRKVTIKPVIITLLVNLQDISGSTLLHYASENSSLPMLELLVLNGGKPNIQDRLGNTALHYAVINGWAEGVEILERITDTTLKNKDITPGPSGRTFTGVGSPGKTPHQILQNKIIEINKSITSEVQRLAPEIQAAFDPRSLLANMNSWTRTQRVAANIEESQPMNCVQNITRPPDFEAMYGKTGVSDS
jgi:ankyrin repeat protein